MGYKSDVTLAMLRSDFLLLYVKISQIGEDEEDFKGNLLNFFADSKIKCYKEYPKYVVLNWSNINWNGDEVNFLDNFLVDRKYNMVIIGENDDDIEVKNTAGEYVLEVIKKAVVYTDAYSKAKIIDDGQDICYYCNTIEGYTTLCSCNRFCPLNSSCDVRLGAKEELREYNTCEKAVL